MKFKPNYERDYKFYFDNKSHFSFAGTDLKTTFNVQYPTDSGDANGLDDEGNIIPWRIPFSEEGKSAKAAFYKLDSEGKGSPCCEPHLLVELLTCKASVNLHIKMWAEGWAECTMDENEIQDIIKYYNCPDWAFKAIENQKEKILQSWIDNKQYLVHNLYAEALFLHRLGNFSHNDIK